MRAGRVEWDKSRFCSCFAEQVNDSTSTNYLQATCEKFAYNRGVSQLLSFDSTSDSDEWDEFVASQGGHLLQSFAWGHLKSRFGWHAERYAWRNHSKIRAGAQVLYRALAPRLVFAYVPRGPVIIEESASEFVAFLESLQRQVRKHHPFLLRIEPNWQSGDPGDLHLKEAGFRPTSETIQPRTTIFNGLSPDLDTILAKMKPKWRYNIRLAQRKGVRVRQGDASDLEEFVRLIRLTGARDRFALHSGEYYRAAFDLLTARDQACLFVADFEDQPLAMIFVAAFGETAIYLYGASGDSHRNLMPNHALQWAAIQWAKARGCKWYDWWGVPDAGTTNPALSQANSSLPESLYQFKQGFGGKVVKYSGAWDYVYNPGKFQIYRAARKFRKNALG